MDVMTADQSVAVPRRRRRLRLGVVGVVLTVVCAAGFAVVAAGTSGDRAAVLVAGTDLAAGQLIAADDLSEANVTADGVGLIPAGDTDAVVGRVAVVPVLAGTPITHAMVGEAAAVPGPGRMEASLPLGPGQFPPDLSVGAPVAVFVAGDPAMDGSTGGVSRVDAVVTGVVPDAVATVITIEVAAADAATLAGTDPASVSVMRAAADQPPAPPNGTGSESDAAGGTGEEGD